MVVQASVSDVQANNVTTNGSQFLDLVDARESSHGATVSVEDCELWNTPSALVAYVQPEDNLAVERSQFHAATAWLYAGSSASCVAANSKQGEPGVVGRVPVRRLLQPERAGGGHGPPAVAVQHDGGRVL